MSSRSVFQNLAEQRLMDAQLLLETSRFPAAYYLAGYSIECALKACICKTLADEALPTGDLRKTYFIHKLDTLLKLSGLEKDFLAKAEENPSLARNWKIICDWGEDKRYDAETTEEMANVLIDAINDHTSGVLQWIKQRW